MTKLTLTAAAIKRLKRPEKGQVDYWDDVLSPFALRISYNGTMAWITQPRVLSKGLWKPVRITLGRYPAMSLAEARKAAREAINAAERGEDPREHKKQARQQMEAASANTFAAVRQQFLDRHCRRHLKPRSAAEYARALSCAFESWDARPIASITRRDVRHLLEDMAETSPVMANRTLAYLRKLMNWAVANDFIETPPTDRVPSPAKEKSRERFLSDNEIACIWKACDALGSFYARAIQMLILTGQRSSEVAHLHWRELRDIYGAAPTWELPQERAKNNLPHVVPLAPLALDVLRAVPNYDSGDYIFSIAGDKPIHMSSKLRDGVDKKAREIAENEHLAGCFETEWVVHDIRRTVVTWLNTNGTPPHIVEAIVNHISGTRAGVAGVYNRAQYLAERREALTRWADHVKKITE